MSAKTLDKARAVKSRALDLFRHKSAVVGVGIRRVDGSFGVKANLESASDPKVKWPETMMQSPSAWKSWGRLGTDEDGSGREITWDVPSLALLLRSAGRLHRESLRNGPGTLPWRHRANLSGRPGLSGPLDWPP